MTTEEYKQYVNRVAELFTSIQDTLPETISTGEIYKKMEENGIEVNSIFQPSDVCYNHTTKSYGKDEGFENSVHFLEYVERGKYRFLGLDYPYTGLVVRKRKTDGKEIIIGEWFNGKLIKWDRNAQQDISEYEDNYKQLAQEISEEIDSLELQGEEKKALVKVRVNQGVFRDRLLKRYSHCCLCGVSEKALLRASHIKPWVDCEPNEKLDVNNGFLLCPNHDALFDKHYISFEDDGSIILSDKLNQVDRVFMNVREDMKIELCTDNIKYLAYHRENVLR